MYLSLIVTFLLILVIAVTAVQNTVPVDFKFFTWSFQISVAALISLSALFGGVIVAILVLPKLARKSLHGRSMNREIHRLKDEILDAGKRDVDGSHTG